MASSDFIAQEADGTRVASTTMTANLPTRVCLQCKQHRRDSHFLGGAHSWRLAGYQSRMRRGHELSALATNSHPLSTEIFRVQSSSIRNVTMNGDIRYTLANMNLPNYYDSYQG